MDKIIKALNKLTKQERVVAKAILIKLNKQQLLGLDIKKLKGHSDIYRIRKGKLRIIYKQSENTISILTIERRTEKTYKDY